ncbi:HIT domain-containing protein [Thaumasiovibrio sp. DFM-14]|uniref:HIT domain-containing protein n=1 Tax=Thaumasiovibrio sp. DFM-14 TaxID=3384792 RepID=UPI0039A28FD7
MDFILHPRLEADTSLIGNLPLCQVRLIKEAIGPWIILVPKRPNITELHHLSEKDQQQLIKESGHIAEVLEHDFHANKINLGALGNLVPQLHWHVIARYKNDVAWPGPIWGNTSGIKRDPNNQTALIDELTTMLDHIDGFSPRNS